MNRFKELLDGINLEIRARIIHPFKSIKRGIYNYWIYRKIIWNDRWFDHSFFISLIDFKLQTLIDNWDNSNYIGSNFTKKRIMVIKNRIASYEDNLDELYTQYYDKKLSKSELIDKINKLNEKTWKELGRNLIRFWD